MTREPVSTEAKIADHYRVDGLLDSIRAALSEMGKSPATVTVADLGPVDEFHIGGRTATTELCERLDVAHGSSLLDIGCGIGGSARFVASSTGCRVTGIDLTAEYIAVARALSEWTGQQDSLRFETAGALDMPFADASFDGALQLHVGMNIADKAALFAEVFRVLRPGSRFVVYDIMRKADGEIAFPVPWASGPATSFVDDPPTYRSAMNAAGFEVVEERDRSDFAQDFFATLQERIAREGGPAPLGLHLIMGPDGRVKIANMVRAVSDGLLAPTEMVGQKPAS